VLYISIVSAAARTRTYQIHCSLEMVGDQESCCAAVLRRRLEFRSRAVISERMVERTV